MRTAAATKEGAPYAARFNVLVLNGRHPGSPGGSRASAVETSCSLTRARVHDPYRSRRTIVEPRHGQWMRIYTRARREARSNYRVWNVIFGTKFRHSLRVSSRFLAVPRLSNKQTDKKWNAADISSKDTRWKKPERTRSNGYPKSKIVDGTNKNGVRFRRSRCDRLSSVSFGPFDRI